MKYKKFFVQVDCVGMMSRPNFFSSRNAAIRSYQAALNWDQDGYAVWTNAKSIKEPVFPNEAIQ
jgi:hypothetical protein